MQPTADAAAELAAETDPGVQLGLVADGVAVGRLQEALPHAGAEGGLVEGRPRLDADVQRAVEGEGGGAPPLAGRVREALEDT